MLTSTRLKQDNSMSNSIQSMLIQAFLYNKNNLRFDGSLGPLNSI